MTKLLNAYRVYVIGGNEAVKRIFQEEGAVAVDVMDSADIVVWTGGSDVSPELYKENKHPRTYTNPERDVYEHACFKRAKQKSALLIGICRGGQFLNVMNGGSLWQHVDNHAINGEHPMEYTAPISRVGGSVIHRTVKVTSTHHQMMIPYGRVEVWGKSSLATMKESGVVVEGRRIIATPVPPHSIDSEILWYPKTRSLCFQPHPEYSSKSTRDIFFTCIERALAA